MNKRAFGIFFTVSFYSVLALSVYVAWVGGLVGYAVILLVMSGLLVTAAVEDPRRRRRRAGA